MVSCPKCKATDEPTVTEGVEANSKWQTVNIHVLAVWTTEGGARHECRCYKCGHQWEF